MDNTYNLYLAPFQGVTGHTFRQVYSRHFKGINKFYTPFFSKIDHETRLSDRKIHELQHLNDKSVEVVPQILSKEASEIIKFAHICQNLGFKELNWNLGCPYPRVADKKRGSGILPYPEMINDILEQVMPQMPLKFSIKCRLGYENPDEILNIIPVFNSFPIHELTVHSRIGRQLYSGVADNNAFERLIPLVKSTLVHNGDLLSYSDFKELSTRMPSIDSFMIGRGVLSNPFLPEEINGYDQTIDKKSRLKTFMDDLYFGYRKDMNDRLTSLNVLKEYWDYLSNWFDNPHKVSKTIKKVKTFDEYEDAVKDVFTTT